MAADRKPWTNQLDSYCILINNTHGYKNIIDCLKKSRGNVETRQKTCLKSDQYLHSGNSPRSVIGQSRTWAKPSTRKMILLTTRHQEACRTGCITPGRATAMPAPITRSIFMLLAKDAKLQNFVFSISLNAAAVLSLLPLGTAPGLLQSTTIPGMFPSCF